MHLYLVDVCQFLPLYPQPFVLDSLEKSKYLNQDLWGGGGIWLLLMSTCQTTKGTTYLYTQLYANTKFLGHTKTLQEGGANELPGLNKSGSERFEWTPKETLKEMKASGINISMAQKAERRRSCHVNSGTKKARLKFASDHQDKDLVFWWSVLWSELNCLML